MENSTIPWEAIWQYHAPNFKNGFAHIPLPGRRSFPLKPGPAFGDGSHPTTKLMLTLLEPVVKDKVVVDIGLGTGILSIASALLGAKKVYAFEIDPDAILHAKLNISLNNLDSRISINNTPPMFDIVLINMISSEQKQAFASYPFLQTSNYNLLASGILQEEKETYLQDRPFFHPEKIVSLNNWIAFSGLVNTTNC